MSATQNAPIVVVKKAWEDEATKQELVDYVTVENEEGGETSRKIATVREESNISSCTPSLSS